MPDMMTSGEVSRPRRCPTELKRTDRQQEKQTMMGGLSALMEPAADSQHFTVCPPASGPRCPIVL